MNAAVSPAAVRPAGTELAAVALLRVLTRWPASARRTGWRTDEGDSCGAATRVLPGSERAPRARRAARSVRAGPQGAGEVLLVRRIDDGDRELA